MNKRVLVTGSEGFTGKYLVSELQAHGYEVIGMGNQASRKYGYVQADLTNVSATRAALADVRPDIIVHLAALAFVGHGNPNDFYRVNLIGSRNLLEAVSSSNKQPESILLVSSANIYGNQNEGMLNESTSPAPANDYAVSKLAMEHMARTWMPKLPVIIVRPFNYTGIGQPDNFLLPKIVSHFRRKEDVIELGNLDVSRDFSDVRSVAEIYRKLIEERPTGHTFNVASGRPYSLLEVLDLCSEITGHDIEIRVNPAFVRANEVKTLCGDNTRLREHIGHWYSPSLKDTLRWMLEGDV